jgi:hypothetical protein
MKDLKFFCLYFGIDAHKGGGGGKVRKIAT